MQVNFLLEIYNPPPSDFMPWDVGLVITDDLMHPYRAERASGLPSATVALAWSLQPLSSWTSVASIEIDHLTQQN